MFRLLAAATKGGIVEMTVPRVERRPVGELIHIEVSSWRG
jgi:hypothetical protein